VLLDKTTEPEDPLYGAIHAEAVGVAGFSFGGFTSLAAAAGTADGQVPADSRVKAIMPIARGSFLPQPVSLADVQIPTLLFAGEQDDFGLDDQARRDLRTLSSDDKFLAIVDPANHTDVGWTRCQQSPSSTICPNDKALEVETILATAFFSRYLEGQDDFASVLSQSYAVQHEPAFEFWTTAVTDTNGDKRTGFGDFVTLSNAFGTMGSDAARSRADFNRDRHVDFADFVLLSINYTGDSVTTATVPEPAAQGLAAGACLLLVCVYRSTRESKASRTGHAPLFD
jgi:hypothetical protein